MQLRIQLQSKVLAGLRGAAVVLAGGLALAGCGAGHDADCLKSNGPVVTQRRAIDRRLTDVVCYDNVDVTIVPDTANYAEVRAGENVIDDIVFTPQGAHRLLITNTSRCNWVRSYNTPREVRLHVRYLKDVEQRGYGLITTEGQFKQDTLFVHSSSTGDINLNVDCGYLFIDIYDAGDMTLRGQATEFHPFLGSNGFLFASALQTQQCYYVVYPSSYGDAHVRASQIVDGTSNGHGTFYYAGNPINFGFRGPGKVAPE